VEAANGSLGGQRVLTTMLDAARPFFELSPDAVLITDSDGTILMANAQVEVLFGHAPLDVVGEQIEALIPDRFHALEQPHHRPMGLGLDLFGRRRDGSEFPVDVSIAAVETGDGKILAASVRDITKRKELEAVRDRFISNAAHELRTPLTAIQMAVEVLARRQDSLSSAQSERALDALMRQCNRATLLVTNLLDLSNLEGDRLSINLELIDLGSALAQLLASQAPPPDVTVSCEGLDGVLVEADSIRLDQILTNLMTNAFRYGGLLVTVRARRRADWVEIELEDDGPGIDPNVELFEPFSRGANAGSVGGSGLGLALCRSLVEAQGGKIWYEPGQPHGARMVFRLRAGS
jgi:protein-histidine pros-kinase